MRINFGLLGQIAVCWIILGLVVSPYIGRALRRARHERTRRHFREVKKQVVLNRAQIEQAVRSDLQDSEYQQRARRAEALGFIEPEDISA